MGHNDERSEHASVESWDGIPHINECFAMAKLPFHRIARSGLIADGRKEEKIVLFSAVVYNRLRSPLQDRRRSQKCGAISFYDPRSAAIIWKADSIDFIDCMRKNKLLTQSRYDQNFICKRCRQREFIYNCTPI